MMEGTTSTTRLLMLKPRNPYQLYMRASRYYDLDAYRVWAATYSSKASPANIDVFQRWAKYLTSEEFSLARAVKYVSQLRTLELLMQKPFVDANEEDIRELVARIDHGGYRAHYRHDLKCMIKKFYRWLRNAEYAREVEWIRSRARPDRLSSDALLTEEDVRALMNSAKHPRDRAIIATLYESGCRMGELGTMRVGALAFDEFGVVLTVSGKTGKRRVRLVWSAAHLKTWLAFHPNPEDLQAPLWTLRSGDSNLGYPGFKMLIERLAHRAGIQKRVNPTVFRHSRATLLAKHLTEPQMREVFGWTPSSQQPATYVHFSGRDVDEAILRLHGLFPGRALDGDLKH